MPPAAIKAARVAARADAATTRAARNGQVTARTAATKTVIAAKPDANAEPKPEKVGATGTGAAGKSSSKAADKG
jgi:hypothetical protein